MSNNKGGGIKKDILQSILGLFGVVLSGGVRVRLAGFLIVFGCLFVGQAVIWLTKLPLPPSIIGLLLLFGLLQSKLIKIEQVQSLARVLLDYLAFLIVPACISLMQYFDVIKMDFWAIIGATVLGTLLVLFATGHSYQLVRKLGKTRPISKIKE